MPGENVFIEKPVLSVHWWTRRPPPRLAFISHHDTAGIVTAGTTHITSNDKQRPEDFVNIAATFERKLLVAANTQQLYKCSRKTIIKLIENTFGVNWIMESFLNVANWPNWVKCLMQIVNTLYTYSSDSITNDPNWTTQAKRSAILTVVNDMGTWYALLTKEVDEYMLYWPRPKGNNHNLPCK